MITILWNVFLGLLILILLAAGIGVIGTVVWLTTEAIRDYKEDAEFYKEQKAKMKKELNKIKNNENI